MQKLTSYDSLTSFGWVCAIVVVLVLRDIPLETEFETEKSDVGLDEYETRTWAGWHHHIALCLLAGAFLLSLQQAWGEKDAADHPSAEPALV